MSRLSLKARSLVLVASTTWIGFWFWAFSFAFSGSFFDYNLRARTATLLLALLCVCAMPASACLTWRSVVRGRLRPAAAIGVHLSTALAALALPAGLAFLLGRAQGHWRLEADDAMGVGIDLAALSAVAVVSLIALAVALGLRRARRTGPPRGFTLIEMMVVVAVVAILALLMVPAYIDRLIRGQIGDALPLADIAKRPIEASWTLARTLPADNASIGLPVPEKVVSNYVSALSVQGGAIHITFGNRAHNQIRGRVLSLRPAIVADAPVVPIAWVCGYAAPPGNMAAQGANRTDIPAGYLPPQCR